ncbi:MAG: DNA polymerase III subunit delta [candidate division Zixibacteria bacterium]|nr:DNA polymerase III subunit delta [candidate division Zixibacteria bacterium]
MGEKITYSQWLNKLKSGTKDPAEKMELLYHLTGEEDFLKEEAWKKIVSILVPDELKSFNLDLLYGAEISADQIINKASTSPVNAKRRVVVVFDLDKLSVFSKDVLLSFLPKFPDSVCLILLSPKITSPAKFHKALEKLATTVEFPRLWESQTSAWITNRIKEEGKKIERGAVFILQNLVGNNLADLVTEINKLVTYIGERDTIASSDVESVAGLSRTHTIFQLIDSIGEKDTKGSLLILRNLVSSGEKPGGIIFWLTQHLEKLIQTKEFPSGSGVSLASFLKTKPFLASKYQKHAPNFSLEELEKGLIILYQTDVDLKSNLMPDKMLLELLVYNLCHL